MALKSLGYVSILALCLFISFTGNLRAETDKNKDFHAIHMMLNHGLNMIMDGSSLIMMAEMDLDITVEKDPLVHGTAMIDNGKTLIDRALHGPVMVDMHMQGMEKSKVMELTHQLGGLMLKTVYAQDIMQPAMKGSEIAKKLHVLHLEANHALMMSAQGSNMVMIGQYDRSNDLNRFSFENGQKMMSAARTILFDLLNGNTMKDLENKDLTPAEAALFKNTKDQLLNSIDIANLLIQMEFE